jgi:hypothetical protein
LGVFVSAILSTQIIDTYNSNYRPSRTGNQLKSHTCHCKERSDMAISIINHQSMSFRPKQCIALRSGEIWPRIESIPHLSFRT